MLVTMLVAVFTAAVPYLPGGVTTQQAGGTTTHIFGLVGDWDPLPVHPQIPEHRGAFFQFDCPKHDPTLGRLLKVEVGIWKRSRFVWQLEVTDVLQSWSQTCWMMKYQETTFLEAQVHHWPMYTSPWSGFTAPGLGVLLDPFDGILDFMGVSGHTSVPVWGPWESDWKTYTVPLLLADFTGRAPMPMELTTSTGFFTMSQYQSEVGRLDGRSFVRVFVRYTY